MVLYSLDQLGIVILFYCRYTVQTTVQQRAAPIPLCCYQVPSLSLLKQNDS